MKKEKDSYLALLTYRATLLQCGFSPSELLIARKLRTNIPMTSDSLKPAVPDRALLQRREEQYKQKIQTNFDLHHGARDLERLGPGQ